MKVIQGGKLPTLYMVLMSTITLREAFSSSDALVNYNTMQCPSDQRDDSRDLEDAEFELEGEGSWSCLSTRTKTNVRTDENEWRDPMSTLGIKWLRERVLILFNEMFILDVRHYCSTLLHPKYRLLKGCNENERAQCHKFIREQLKILRSSAAESVRESVAPEPNKFRKNEDLFSRFEEDHPLNNSFIKYDPCSSESDEYDFDVKQSDELDRYLTMEIDKSTVSNDPLEFWRLQAESFPLLAQYAKHIHSIPATSASVERQFSAAGLVINDRRTNLNPQQLDNILLVRSVQKLK